MNLPRVGPDRKAGEHVKLPKKFADDAIGVAFGAEPIQLRHDPGQRPLYFADDIFRVELTLRVETPLTLEELFAIEV